MSPLDTSPWHPAAFAGLSPITSRRDTESEVPRPVGSVVLRTNPVELLVFDGVVRLNVLCLDLEGVLVPEVWQAVADRTGITALRKTTRDIPVYDDLMRARLAILDEHSLPLSTIRDVIAGLDPLPGASDFLDWARERYQVAILSDTFYEFGMPLMAKLGHPLLLCHRLIVDGGRIVGYRLRQDDPKRQAVRAFHAMNYRVIAAGDSYNDVAMLDEADVGLFFDAPPSVVAQYPSFQAVTGYDQLVTALGPHA